MTKKELSQLYYLKKEIKEQQRRLKELEILSTNCTAKVTGLPNGNGVSDKIANYATEIADLKSLLDLNLKKCFYELNRLDRFIQSIDDAFIRQTVLYRFEKNMSWSQIARMLGGNNKAESIRKKLYRYLKKN